jgi:hypothetical protein
VPYNQSAYTEVDELLTPTPERLATAKAWLARRLEERRSLNVEGDPNEFAAEQGADYPYSGDDQVDERFPEAQERVIPYWQWVQALRYAIQQFERAGIVIGVVQSNYNARESPPFTSTVGPRIPLGRPGEQTQPTPFPTPILYAQYRLALLSESQLRDRLELYDADLYAQRAELDRFNDRVQRCVREALSAYRADLFLAAANMLGAASEAAWYELAEAIEQASFATAPLRKELESLSPRAATVEEAVGESLRSRYTTNAEFEAAFGFRRADLEALSQTAAYWRAQRNWGMHPVGADIDVFTDAALGIQLQGASSYLNRVAALLDGVRPGSGV